MISRTNKEANNSGTIIRVKSVFFSYDGPLILEDINLPVNRGDFLAIIGPNGSGKTTLLKIMVGLLKPQSGQVFLFEQKLEDFREWFKVAYIQQNATYLESKFPISVGEVIASSLYASRIMKGKPSAWGKEKTLQVLELVGLSGYQKRVMATLSGGQQQRVLIARALASEPEIMLLDEPTTGVDHHTQENFYDLLGKLNHDYQLTIVVVTHDYGLVNKHINQVACLNRKLIYHGRHEEFCQSSAFKELLEGGHHLIVHQH
ncbi:MAG: metal ABC transporter ATP-binding protein [Acidobacteriota bacterium]|nr:metal ABC transporter ATP-binding protein [Acidobacteriota bacterium]